MNEKDFNNIGKQIRDAVTDALDSQNFTELRGMIESTVKEFADSIPAQNPQRTRNPQVQRRATPVVIQRNLVRTPVAPEGATSVIKTTVGMTGALVMGAIVVTELVLVVGGMASFGGVFVFSGFTAFFSWLAGSGISTVGKRTRFRKYWKTLQPHGYATIDELTAAVTVKRPTVIKDLKYMMEKGYFGEAYLDEQGNTFMLGRENYERYLHTLEERNRRQNEEQIVKNDPEGLVATTSEGQRWIEQIRKANDALPGEVISEKLDRLELVTSKIFAHVEKYPDQLPSIRKFMSYYLPTTLKLVNAYQEFEKQPVQGANITKAKQEIEATLDTINVAFENLLNDMFQKAALDVSTEISVLETILAQEGLTASGFEKMTEDKKEASTSIEEEIDKGVVLEIQSEPPETNNE